MLGSFKIKLVGTFLALSVVPLAAAFWGFSAVAERSVTSSVDDRLGPGLNAALAAFEDERQNAEAAAQRLGRDPAFQQALADRDRAAISGCCPSRRRCGSRRRTGLRSGARPASAAETTVSLVGPGDRSASDHRLGAADVELADRLHARSGLSGPDELAFVGRGRQVDAASGPDVAGSTRSRRTDRIVADRRPRVSRDRRAARAGEHADAGRRHAQLRDRLREANVLGRLLIGLLGSLLLIACVAYLAGRSIVGALGRLADAAHSIAAGRLEERVEVRGRDEFAQLGRAFNQMAAQLEGRLEDLEDERRRLREANARFGDALASDARPGAASARHRRVRRRGDAGRRRRRHRRGRLVRRDRQRRRGRAAARLRADERAPQLRPPAAVGDDFDAEERMTAASLAGQAVVALENARLHRMVERQALVDGLTGLANRRQADEALASELARTERLGGPVGLILADVDDFKAVNDRYGHPTGDIVLRDLPTTLRENGPRDRHRRPLGRGGVRGDPAGHRPRGRGTGGRADQGRARRAEDRLRRRVAARTSPRASASQPRLRPPRCSSSSKPPTRSLYRAKRAGKDRVYAGTDPVTPCSNSGESSR